MSVNKANRVIPVTKNAAGGSNQYTDLFPYLAEPCGSVHNIWPAQISANFVRLLFFCCCSKWNYEVAFANFMTLVKKLLGLDVWNLAWLYSYTIKLYVICKFASNVCVPEYPGAGYQSADTRAGQCSGNETLTVSIRRSEKEVCSGRFSFKAETF